MNFYRCFRTSIIFFMSLFFLLPLTASAHIISISATSPFPAQVVTASTATATYTITNIAAQIPLTVIDQSKFPSGMSILNSTCGNLMNPGQSCVITLKLTAPTSAQTLTGTLIERASPSADFVQTPISVAVTAGSPPPPPPPPPPPTVTLVSIVLAPTNVVVASSGTQQYSVTGTYSDTSTHTITNGITWTSSDLTVATISNSGLATVSTTNRGQTTITATIQGKTASTTLFAQPYAYVTNFFAGKVSQCTINNSGTFTAPCTDLSNAAFTTLYGIVFNSALPTLRVYLGIEDGMAGAVLSCPVLSSGAFGTCVSYTDPSFNNYIYGVALSTAKNMFYTVNSASVNVSQCPMNAVTGALSACTTFVPTGITSVSSITISSDSSIAYIPGSNVIYQCPINSLGNLTNPCTIFTSPTFNYPGYIAINSAGTMAYIANVGSNSISQCSVNTSGLLTGTCTNFINALFNGPSGIAVIGNNAFISNGNGSSVTSCPIVGDVITNNCVDSGAGNAFSSPYSIAIH